MIAAPLALRGCPWIGNIELPVRRAKVRVQRQGPRISRNWPSYSFRQAADRQARVLRRRHAFQAAFPFFGEQQVRHSAGRPCPWNSASVTTCVSFHLGVAWRRSDLHGGTTRSGQEQAGHEAGIMKRRMKGSSPLVLECLQSRIVCCGARTKQKRGSLATAPSFSANSGSMCRVGLRLTYQDFRTRGCR